jgi:PadR family transcriptional regulator PadR
MSRTEVIAGSILSLLGDGPGHGYGMVERLVQLGYDRPAVGSVYAALRRFERAGMVTSCWEHQPSGPSRRVYRLTAEGARSAQAAMRPRSGLSR